VTSDQGRIGQCLDDSGLKSMALLEITKLVNHFASRGYVVVVQDVRGRGDWEDEFNFFFQETPDGLRHHRIAGRRACETAAP
jgi:predicted acyl esterase